MANNFEVSGAIQPEVYWNMEQARADELRRARQAQRIETAQASAAVLTMPGVASKKEYLKGQPSEAGPEDDSYDENDDFAISDAIRQRRIAKQAKARKSASGIISTITSPFQTATSNLLVQAWLNLIDSFGLTLIWINIHVFLRFITSDSLFVKLGHEWVGEIPGSSLTSKAAKRAVDEAGNAIGVPEVCLLLLLDFIAFFLLLALLAIFLTIVSIWASPWLSIKAIFSLLYDLIF